METRPADLLKSVFLLIALLCSASSQNDLDFAFCGTWRHGRNSLRLNIHLSTGCDGISISANESTLSINGKVTAWCMRSEVIDLSKFGLSSEEDSNFCLYWEPLMDHLKLQVRGKNLTLCWPASRKDTCCTDLTNGANAPEAKYGIANGAVRNDTLSERTRAAYTFDAQSINTDELCKQADRFFLSNTVQTGMRPPCARRFESVLKSVTGSNITSPATSPVSSEPAITVLIPHAVNHLTKVTNKVVITFFNRNPIFQEGHKEAKLLNDVVEISVENEVIVGLKEPIKIGFNHDVIPKKHSRKCVSWDTRKDSLLMKWSADGCETVVRGDKHTECQCNHLTYFTVLVEMEPRPVRHLLALTAITSVGCAVSFISCVAIIVHLCRKRRSKELSIPIHLGLAISLALLSLLFFFTGILANVGGEDVCSCVGGMLHYALLSSFTWMGIETFHTFWLVYMVFSPSPKPYVWNLVGFVLPLVPVGILFAVGNIYGQREVVPSDDVSNPYLMCWMKSNGEALLAHYFTNMTALVILVLSGLVMLVLVFRKIRTRDEWNQNRVAFLSIWGLSCLFGTAWGLALLNFEPLSDVIHFLFCILNSFQGFFLMLRFCMLDWMRKQASGSVLGSTSSGSTRQHMLQSQEKS
ncbi:adhesion G-protein coupled receptor G1 isoform 2-T4 [Menidia menidia]